MTRGQWMFVASLGLGSALLTAAVATGGVRSDDDYQADRTVTPRIAETDQRDHALQARVEQRLRLHDEIEWENLSVHAKDGRVTLEGVVGSMRERGLATHVAATVPGADRVDNRVVVQGRGVPRGAAGFANPPVRDRDGTREASERWETPRNVR